MRALVAILLLAVLAACGSAAASTDALRQARALASVTGEIEDRAEALTVGLTEALSAPAESPEAAVARLGEYVTANVEEMNAVAAVIVERLGAMSDQDARAYTEVMSDRMSGPTFAWRDAYFGFIDEHPDLADALREAAEPLGEQIPPVERPF